jgi:hypothetical protein
VEKTIEMIRADIATLSEHVALYRRLAAERRAADHMLIADKLTEAAVECEARAAELERMLAEQRKPAN